MPFENDLSSLDRAVIVALGSNLAGAYESVEALLEAALEVFPAHGLMVVNRSAWWRSQAWPNPTDPPFINCVALIETPLSPSSTLEVLHKIEMAFGRRRHVTNAPRTLDLDLIAHGRTVSIHPALPHPRAHQRAFVMRPLAQIAPEWIHPVFNVTAAELAGQVTVGLDARQGSHSAT